MASKISPKRKRYEKEAMVQAIRAVKEQNLGYLQAAKIYNVPRRSLFRHCQKDEDPATSADKKLGRPTVLTKELEDKLIKYLLHMESKYFGLTRNDIRNMAYQLAVRNNLPNPFGKETAGKEWLFMRRHSNKLPFRRPTGTSFARAKGFSKENVQSFFKILTNEFEKYNYPADRIYNVDESGLSIVPSKIPQIVALKGKRQVGSLTSAERGSLITVVFCMSAGGHFVPPLVIFPRKNLSQQLTKGAPPGTKFEYHPSGWIPNNIFTKWFQHFIATVNPTPESPVLLILDGHNSHTRNIDIINMARDNNVTIVCLPPHSTHKLQPLDKSFMGPFKAHYSEEIRTWIRQYARPVTAFDVMEIFCKAYLRVLRREIAVNGFQATGIFPVNPNNFRECDFLAFEIIEQDVIAPLPASEVPENPTPPVELVTPTMVSSVPCLRKKSSNRGTKAGKAVVITASPYKTELESSIGPSVSTTSNKKKNCPGQDKFH